MFFIAVFPKKNKLKISKIFFKKELTSATEFGIIYITRKPYFKTKVFTDKFTRRNIL